MSESKHTPGPWEADCRTGCFAVRRKGDNLNCMSEASRDSIVFQKGRSEELSEPNGYRYLTDEQIANANLIAAAPEMLEALEACCIATQGKQKAFCECFQHDSRPCLDMEGVCWFGESGNCSIWNAIQKARGQEDE